MPAVSTKMRMPPRLDSALSADIIYRLPLGVAVVRQETLGRDESFRFTYLNPAGEAAAKIPSNSMVGSRVVDYDELVKQELHRTLGKSLLTGQIQTLPDVEFNGSSFDIITIPINGRHVAIIFKDITEIQKSKATMTKFDSIMQRQRLLGCLFNS